jgi:hypothetical protein
MPEEKAPEPLDLSSFDHLSEAPAASPAPISTQLITASDARLAAVPPSPRLVEVANLSPEDLAAAQASASKVDFRKTDTLLSHGDHVLAEIAQSSRQLLAGVRLGDAGDVGRIAAAVIDGVKILRIQDLQAESNADKSSPKPKGLVGKIMGTFADAHTAFKGFQENRKQFLTLMDQEEAKARKTKADLTVNIANLDQQAVASQAAVQVDIRRAADESEKLDEAARQITLLASKGAHDAATSAARSLGGDQRNIDVLAQVADEAIQTMNEVITIEREVAAGDRDREAKLTAIRDRLGAGMRGVAQNALKDH